VRLATWNIHNGIPADGGPVDTTLLRTSAASLGADVLALQEVDRGQPRSGLADQAVEVAEEVGAVAWRYVPTLVGTPPQRWRSAVPEDEEHAAPAYGVALLSQHPVRSWHVLRMAPGPLRVRVERGSSTWWAGDEPRVAVAAVLQTPHGAMTVVSTHLSFLPGPNVRQLRRLVRWVDALPAPRVVLGDLNLPGAVVARLSGLEMLARAPTHPAHAPRLQLDHALGHGDLPPARARTRSLPVSDHLALVVDLSPR
jgi:endonuclease/exonuclease/phosphatase family metal-dependent hydrolase